MRAPRANPRTTLSALATAAILAAGCASSDAAAPMPPDLHFDDAGLKSGSRCPPDRSLTYETFARAFFATYCTRCHSSQRVGLGARSGATPGFDFDTLEHIRPHIGAIDTMAGAGPAAVNELMPPTAPSPSEAERRHLGAWLACREGVALDGSER
jgi:hypothetical protein